MMQVRGTECKKNKGAEMEMRQDEERCSEKVTEMEGIERKTYRRTDRQIDTKRETNCQTHKQADRQADEGETSMETVKAFRNY